MADSRTANQQAPRESWRHEWKYELFAGDLPRIRARLQAVAKRDPHAGKCGRYRVRSLYFDDYADSALWEKINGEDPRAKFRIRYYNEDTSLIRLEKKIKRGGMCLKVSEPLSLKEVNALMQGNFDWMTEVTETHMAKRPLVAELYSAMCGKGLGPRVIVDYEREPYIYDAGNVRITFDYDLRTSYDWENFLTLAELGMPAGYTPLIMEVKWDAFLPSVIQSAIQTDGCPARAFSKYAQCRIFN